MLSSHKALQKKDALFHLISRKICQAFLNALIFTEKSSLFVDLIDRKYLKFSFLFILDRMYASYVHHTCLFQRSKLSKVKGFESEWQILSVEKNEKKVARFLKNSLIAYYNRYFWFHSLKKQNIYSHMRTLPYFDLLIKMLISQ